MVTCELWNHIKKLFTIEYGWVEKHSVRDYILWWLKIKLNQRHLFRHTVVGVLKYQAQ